MYGESTYTARTVTNNITIRVILDWSSPGGRLMTIRLGVVGSASFYGPHYASLITDAADAEVVGIVPDSDVDDDALLALGRPTRSELRARFGTLHDSLDDLLAGGDLDGIVVASPTSRRADDAVRALREGVMVLTAKPAASSSVEAASIADTAAKADVFAMTTTPSRYDTAVRDLSRRVSAGRIGDPIAIQATIRHDRVPETGIEWNAEHAPEEAGAVLAMGYYTADLVRWLCDSLPVAISGTLTNANTPHSTHPDTGLATVEFDSGLIASMRLQYATDCREPLGNWEVEVVGTDGLVRTVHHGYEGFEWTDTSDGGRETRVFGRTPSPVLKRQLDAFLTAIRNESYPNNAASPEDVVASLEVCEAWRAASDRETRISLDEGSRLQK